MEILRTCKRGHQAIKGLECKTCRRITANSAHRKRTKAVWFAENRERQLEYFRAWGIRNWKKTLLKLAETRARKQMLTFSIGPEDLELPDVCPVLGIPIILGCRMKDRDFAPSLDRTIPILGYTRENINIISFRANRIKNDGTANELRLVAAYMELKS